MFAFYSIGCLSIPPLGIFEQSVNRVLIPKLATLLPSQSSNAIAAFQKSISDLQRILIPATVGLILFSEPIIILLFTEKFKPAADFLKIYALHYILLSLPFDSVLRAQGNGQWILKNAIVGGVATFLFTAIGYKFFSLQGALWGSVFGNALNCFLGIYLSKKQARWSWAEVISAKSFGLYLATSLIIASACHFLRVFFFSETLWFLVCGTLFVPIYFFAVMGIPWLQSKWKHRHATS
jgi:peptidoglycan biosynthesis protein MviN/MurJ (putative lipid II flippase)